MNERLSKLIEDLTLEMEGGDNPDHYEIRELIAAIVTLERSTNADLIPILRGDIAELKKERDGLREQLLDWGKAQSVEQSMFTPIGVADLLQAQLTEARRQFFAACAERDAMRERETLFRNACIAALVYDDSIAGRAIRGEVDLMAQGGSANGDDLNALYHDWINKARAALQKFLQL